MEQNNINVFEDNFIIVDGEVEPLTVLKPVGILDLFQTVAGIHALKLGMGLKDLMKNNLAWVLMRVKYDVFKQIPKESKVIVKTWPHPEGKIDYDRDYQILDLDGNVLIKGASKWIIMDSIQRKIARTSAYSYPCECLNERNYDSIDRIRVSLEDFKEIGNYLVSKNEIDVVGHLNNIRYADVIFEFYPCELKSLQIDYLKETKCGETLTIKEKTDGDYIYLAGFVGDDIHFISKFQKQ